MLVRFDHNPHLKFSKQVLNANIHETGRVDLRIGINILDILNTI
jgi:hypothetical protein